MQALFIVLNEIDYLDDILSNFLELDVSGATILDSQGMASVIADSKKDFPMFGLLKSILNESKPYNKTIFTILESQEKVDRVVEMVKATLGKDAKSGAGFMFSVPLGCVYRFDN